jgi:CRP-like cAMP-binding protein
MRRALASARGDMHPHTQLGPLHFFGEMSLLIGDRRSATATAMTYVECVELPKEALFSVLISEPQIILNIAQMITQVV